MKTLSFLAFLVSLAPVSLVAQDNYLIIVDTSGSMNSRMRSIKDSRMEVAKEALKTALADIPEGTANIGIYTFRGWAYRLNTLNRIELNAAIDNMSPSGGTPLYAAIRDSTTEFLKFREKQNNVGTYKIIIVTDGEAGDGHLNRLDRFNDGTPKPGVLSDVQLRGIIVDTIGLDMDQDHSLKKEINGEYMAGDDPTSLQQSIQKAIAEVTTGNDTDTDAFSVIQDLPVNFASAAVTGLTTYHNHPIGEKPFVAVVQEDGTVQMVPQPDEDSSGAQVSFIVIFVMIVIFGVAAIIALVHYVRS